MHNRVTLSTKFSSVTIIPQKMKITAIIKYSKAYQKENTMASIYQKGSKLLTPLIEHKLDPFLSLQNDFNKTMSHVYDLLEPKRLHTEGFEDLRLLPCMDLVETKDCYKIEVEMPGLDEKDIHVSTDGNTLTIVGEKSVSRKNNSKQFIDREIQYGHYERTITLPQWADWEHISADFKKGMLWITVPKKACKKTCAREVKIAKVAEKK